jgi:hypothetical protein
VPGAMFPASPRSRFNRRDCRGWFDLRMSATGGAGLRFIGERLGVLSEKVLPHGSRCGAKRPRPLRNSDGKLDNLVQFSERLADVPGGSFAD